MKKSHSIWKDLVISMLSIYQYSLEKVDRLASGLEKQGLFDPLALSAFSHAEIFSKLEKAGYLRGNINAIFTERLISLGAVVNEGDLNLCEKILSGTDKNEISKLLMPIKGVGPKVLENYFKLRGLNES